MRRRAVFFDRDGVINVSPGDGKFVLTWAEFRFSRGAATQLVRLKSAGFFLVLVTNQSCVGRGLLTLDALNEIHRRMQEALGSSAFNAIYYCPHRPDAGCECRKPAPALILRACFEHSLDAQASYMVGDLPRDIEMGRAAGCRTVFCGQGVGDSRPDHAAKTLRGAVNWILAAAK